MRSYSKFEEPGYHSLENDFHYSRYPFPYPANSNSPLFKETNMVVDQLASIGRSLLHLLYLV